MSKKATLPYDVRLECIAYVRGYPRRVRAYREARAEILDGTHSATEGMPTGSGAGRPAESKAEQLAAIERWPETQKMLAVEYAIDRCGRDIGSDTIRRQLIYGIMRNCQGKHKYSRNRIIVPGISEATFRRRKEKFLFDIATYCGFDRKDEPNST
jgi:hypothetical protein